MKEEENTERPTSNIEVLYPAARMTRRHGLKKESTIWKKGCWNMPPQLLDWFGNCPKDREINYVAGQLLRSGTSPLPNHGEAEAAGSPADFVHKLRVCLKELRETRRWLVLIHRVPLLEADTTLRRVLAETDELIRIFVVSVRTAEKRSLPKKTAAQ